MQKLSPDRPLDGESFRLTFESLAQPAWVHDAVDGSFLLINEAATAAFGYTAEDFRTMRVDDLLTSRSKRDTLYRDSPALSFADAGKLRLHNGAERDFDVSVRRISFEDREAYVVLAVDVTSRRAADDQLNRSERQLAEAQRIAHLASFEWEVASNNVRWSDELYRIYGLTPRQFDATFEAFIAHIHPDDREQVQATIQKTLTTGHPFRMSERIVRPDGEIRELDSRGHLITDHDGNRRLVGVCHDVTDLRQAERERETLMQRESAARQLAEEAARDIRQILERIGDAFMALDKNWRYTYVNTKAAETFGHTQQELIGKHIWSEFPEGVGRPFHLACEEAMRTQQPRQIEDFYRPLNLWFENRIYPSPEGIAVYFQDVTERHQLEAKLRHQALHDDLTTIPNRTLFNDRLEHAVMRATREQSNLAVIVVDLDSFKLVNDNYGHAVGDLLLREVADRLRSALRDTDTIARVGGDEFTVLIEDLMEERYAISIAEKIRRALHQRFEIGGLAIHVSASIGVSTYPTHGHAAVDLFRNADNAMGRAKESGRDTVRLFAASMSERYRDRLAREEELHEAVARGEIFNFYQPILDRGGRITGFETLARWQHPTRGIVGPDEFISLAEETRLIVPIGAKVLKEACRELQSWDHQGLRLSVNLSVRQFHEVNLLATIDQVLEETNFNPALLELEVTESVAMQNVDFTMSLLRQLRSRGISIAIDDFGAGQSSLIYLRQFPINTIKIDKVFIAGMLDDPAAAAIVRAVISLAHDLGLVATAEGVEEQRQVMRLRELGCDHMQGFYFSRPVPAEKARTLLP